MAGTTTRIIDFERQGNILVLTPLRDLRELDFEEIEAERDEAIQLLDDDSTIRVVVVDLGHVDYLGSTVVTMLAQLWQSVRARGERMALCNISHHEREILSLTGLSGLWAIFGTRLEAIRAMSTPLPLARQSGEHAMT